MYVCCVGLRLNMHIRVVVPMSMFSYECTHVVYAPVYFVCVLFVLCGI